MLPFVVIEGIPGAGKTKLRDALIQRLVDRNVPIHHVGQHGWLTPSATTHIVEARKGALGIDGQTLITALIKDKKSHTEQNIHPYRSENVIIADRFYASDVILLACHGNLGVLQSVQFARETDYRPDVCFILENSIEVVEERLEKSRKSRRFLDSSKCIQVAASVLSSHIPGELYPNVVRLTNNTETEFVESLEVAVGIVIKLLQQ